MTACKYHARPDPSFPTGAKEVPAVAYCETHNRYGGCESPVQMTHSDKAREIAFSRHTTDEAYADLIAAALREAENAAYEKAAQVAETTEATPIPPVGWVIANAIRALKDKGE